jgi:ADP-ribose pyrophosphatase YjhB (NUDIX family)
VTARPSLRVGAYAVVERDGAVLLARWLAPDRPRWTLPGGGLDHGEHPRDAAVREVFEETGYRVRLRRLLTVESFRSRFDDAAGPVDHQALCILYTAEVVGGELCHEVGGSTDLAAWVPLDEVAGLDRGGLVDVGLAAVGHGHLLAGGRGTVG